MPELSNLERDGRFALSRRYYGDGRWGADPMILGRDNGEWVVSKVSPPGVVWARATGPLARKVHAVKYTLTAVHRRTGLRQHMTVWRCGQLVHSRLALESHPVAVCAGCMARLSGRTVVPLEEAHV